MSELVTELTLMNTSDNQLSTKLEFVSANSSDIGTTDPQDKLTSSEKKVHWNCKYVQLLLDCVESRMHEFKNKSIHKKVWDDIGKEMQTYGFSTEHCYNKWKNLRRDVRMFAINPNKATKNQETLNRVRKLISTICPNFDPTAVYKKSTKSPNKHSEESSNSLEPLTKLLTPPTSPFSDILTPVNNENMDQTDGNSLLDMKLGGDVYSYLVKQHGGGALLFHPNMGGGGANLFLNGGPDKPECHKSPSPVVQCLQTRSTDNKPSGRNQAALPADAKAAPNYASWPYELYELLVSFRTEEVKQAHSIEQLMRQISEIRDSSVRRMNTIQQLMNLANVLISSKIS